MSSIGKRVFSGAFLLGGVAATAYFMPAVGVWLLLLAFSAAATLELHGILAAAGLRSFRFFSLACGTALITTTLLALHRPPGEAGRLGAAEWDALALAAVVVAVLLRQFPQKNNPQPLSTMACTLLAIFYVPFLMNFFTRLAFAWEPVEWLRPLPPEGRRLIFALLAIVKATDAGAYAVGSTLGRHKMLPRISPSKTWEGLAGGLACGFAASIGFYLLFRQGAAAPLGGPVVMRMRDAVALGILLPAAGVFGDLIESLLKRGAGVKDSGQGLPGLGGLLDTLDSLLLGAPVLYFYARVWLV